MPSRSRVRLVRLLGHIDPPIQAPGAGATRGLSMEDDSILSEVIHGVGCITLNRPKILNALSLQMLRLLSAILSSWRDDPEVKLVVMKGAKAFCAGGDVVLVRQSVLEHPDPTPGLTGEPAADFFREEYLLNYAISTAQKPQVSLWDGFVIGAAVSVSIGSRFRVATEKTVFAMPETAIGLFPDVSWLPRLPGGLGLSIGLTGYRMKAADLIYTGIATHYIPSDRLRDVEKALQDLGSRLHATATPEEIDRVLTRYVEAVDTARAPLALNRAEIDQAFQGRRDMESVIKQLQARAPNNPWAEATLKSLSTVSPTSLKVTLRAMNEGAKLSLEDIFTLEYRLCQGFMRRDSDFVEGVRALLVDKDYKPQWQPAELSAVGPEHVDRFFAPLGQWDLHVIKE